MNSKAVWQAVLDAQQRAAQHQQAGPGARHEHGIDSRVASHLAHEAADRSAGDAAGNAFDEVMCLDAEAVRLCRHNQRTRLRIGEALAALGPKGYQELGFSTLGAYAAERCSKSGAWAARTRRVAKQLAELPLLRRALMRGELGWCMVELLCPHATPLTEAALVEMARERTVRSMREALTSLSNEAQPNEAQPNEAQPNEAQPNEAQPNEAQPNEARPDGSDPGEPEPDEPEPRKTLTVTVSVEEAWALEATRMLIEHMSGSGGNWLEWLLAEGQTSLIPLVEGKILDEEVARWLEQRKHWLAQREAERTREEVQAEQWIEPHRGTEPLVEDDAWGDERPLPRDPAALDRRIRGLCHELASRDLYLGRLLHRLLKRHVWRDLGYASETQYCREHLGLSRASLRSRIALSLKAAWLTPLEKAVRDGSLGTAAASLVARVSSPKTVEAWVERATRRTYKHLQEEVRAAEVMRDIEGRADPMPPDDALRESFEDFERRTLSGELLRQALGIPSEDPDSEPVQMLCGSEHTAVQILCGSDDIASPPTRRATATVRIRVSEDVYLHYRQLERAYQASGLEVSFITFLCGSFWRTWVHHLGKSDKWEPIYSRDRYKCTSPVCLRRDVTLHHMKYRSHGGTDDPDNLTCPCAFCHLEGQHAGRLKILPPAHSPTWILGRSPILVVDGREKRAAA